MAEFGQVEEIKKHVRVYITVFAALAFLTVVTVAVGYMHLAIVPALIVALFIACIKGGLVAAYFMHLISEKRVVAGILIMTVAAFVVMFILFPWAQADQAGL
jgi:cytochrome c oxidase subunit 4